MVRRDTFFEDVLVYLTTGEFWEGATEQDKKAMEEKAANYEVLEGQLYRMINGQRRLVLRDPERRLQVIQECHVAQDGTKHLGREGTKRAVMATYYWSGMGLDIKDFIRQCSTCSSGESWSAGRPPFRAGIGKRSHLWKMVEVEVSGPFSMESKSCLVNVIDLVSKWISCLPVPSLNAKEIARTLVAEFAIMGLPSAVRFVRLTQELATEVVSELEKELDRFMTTLEDVSDLLRQEGSSGEVTCPKLAISQVSEDSQFTIRDLETLEVFVSNRQAQGDLSLYILVGQDSLLEEATRLWHLDTFSRFRKLYPEDTWSERLSYFSYCLRSCLPPPTSVRTPNYLMFFRDMDIFKLAPEKLPSEDEESLERDVEDEESQALQIYRFPDNSGQVSIDFEDEDDHEDKENEEEEYTELSTYQPSDTNGLVVNDISELSERRGLRTSPRKTNSLYARNTSPSMRRKRLPDLYDSEEEEESIPPKKRKKPFIVALRGKDRLSCPQCNEVLSQTELDQHLQFHPDSGPGLRCPVCGKQGHNWGPMYHHFTTSHPEHCPDLTAEDPAPDPDIYSCDDCNFTTKLQRNFRIHRRMHEGVCGLQCQFCKEVFTLRSALSQHMATVHGGGGQRVLCEHCGVSLKSRGSLMAHVKRMHRETQWLLCSHCGFKAKTTSNLNAHIDRIHKKAFHCSICGFATKEKNSYSRHMDIFHNEQRKFPCPQCDYRGANAKSLSEHMRVQHNPTIQRFTCSYCNSTFKTLSMLRDHIPGHTGIAIYSCRLCEYRCKYRSNAHRHAKAKHPGMLVKDCIARAPSQDSTGLGPPKRKDRGSMGSGTKGRPPSVPTAQAYIEPLDTVNDVIVSTDYSGPTAMSLITNPGALTVDTQTGQLLFDTDLSNTNVAVQVVGEHPEDDQTGRAVELLLLAMGQNQRT